METKTKCERLRKVILGILSNDNLDDHEKYEDFVYVVEQALKSTYRAGWIRANAVNYNEAYFDQYNEQGYLDEIQ